MSTAPPDAPRRGRAVGHLALLNAGIAASGLITGPLLARGLGARGRGDLAAIVVILSVVALATEFGLPSFVSREAARGTPLRLLAGSIGPLLLASGLAVGLVGIVLADRLASGDHEQVVRLWLQVGLAILPVSMLVAMLGATARGLEDWSRFIRYRLVSPVLYVVVVVALALTDRITVGRVAALLTVTAVISALPLFAIVRESLPPTFDRTVARAGVAFGARNWFGTLSSIANQRLDQVLMVHLVSRPDLGRYAAVVAISVAPGALSGALGTTVLPRAARGDAGAVAMSLRAVVAVCGAAALVLGLLAEPIVRILLGADFAAAIPILRVLLVAVVPLATTHLLQQSLIGAGHPAEASWAEALALVITVPSLLVTLPRYGAIAAAWVSLAAYTASLAYLLVIARRVWGGSPRTYLVPTPADLRLVLSETRRLMRRDA